MTSWWHSWLRHCATNRRVSASIPDGVIGIFHWHNPSGRTMVLGSTQPLTEMRRSEGKAVPLQACSGPEISRKLRFPDFNLHFKCKLYYRQLHLKYWCNLARYWLQAVWGLHDSVETCSSAIICEIIVCICWSLYKITKDARYIYWNIKIIV